MRNNQPVTSQQRKFKEGSSLISVTDLNGTIEYVNSNFIEISGFTEKELIGQSHNIVRHPDMPEAAFADLWKTVKQGREWRGIVKNRCKDGSYYWVDAYVVPVMKEGKKCGYQSIRSVPSQQQITEAEAIYSKMRSDKSLSLPKKTRWSDINMAKKTTIGVTVVALLLAILLGLVINEAQQTDHIINAQLTLLSSLPEQQIQQQALQVYLTEMHYENNLIYTLIASITLGVFFLWWLVNSTLIIPMSKLRKQLRRISGGDLTQSIEANSNDEFGRTAMAVKLLQARLRTIFDQFIGTTQQLVSSADGVSSSSHNMQHSMQRQSDQTSLIATAMNEMLASVEEVSNSALTASHETATADSNANNGAEVVNTAHNAMTQLVEEVQQTAQVIDQLAEESTKISTITDTISSIAEQTNLLALNAAIEAARAGEQGRGFAVVADEVRSLASRTQEATNEIRTMINNLHGGIGGAVSAMEGNIQQVSLALAEVETSKDSFNSISVAINRINEMNLHIASATEQQQQVSEEMNQNILSISDQSQLANSEATGLQNSALKLNEMALNLQSQLNTIDLGATASEFDFEGAKQAHLAWKTRLRTYLDGDHSVLTKEQACSHRDCKLGLWYYSEGQKRYGNNASFKQIESPHEKLHKVIKNIMDVNESGNKTEAENLYKEIEPLSQQIVDLIDKTKHSLK
ncbi:aerotaxis receptor Aer [Psychromonas sp. psych-6C06]|uniref:methyl-accepting chemotaxis protein n=1 Tax=Psychromonas sp. psych-6C06 TaxID=2058089 RepID=UPI000C321A99|nr:methyl-accepting chemotaxis protein [Psychromonas sp. psych-6C06]PKF62972.1 aerotaxis receptor Aer [Psychromonas sp. psych-6C06]